jgi:hypothetical protein
MSALLDQPHTAEVRALGFAFRSPDQSVPSVNRFEIRFVEAGIRLRPSVVALAVRTVRLRLKVRKLLKGLRIRLDACRNRVSGAPAFDHDLKHDALRAWHPKVRSER